MTSQFTLRPLAPSDADWIFEACQDLEIQKWTQIPTPYTREHAVGFATTLSGDVEVWVIENVNAKKPFGVIGVHSIDPVSMTALIGYWIAPWGRRQGAMKAGLKLYAEKAAVHRDIASIRATIAVENIASRRSAETVGFVMLPDSNESCKCGGIDVKAVTYDWKVKPDRSLLT